MVDNMTKLKIADMVIDIHISDEIMKNLANKDEKDIIHERFYDFLCEDNNDKADIVWKIDFLDEGKKVYGDLLYTISQLDVFRSSDKTYTYVYKDIETVPKMIECKNDFRECVFLISDYHKETIKDIKTQELIKLCLHNMFREMFFYAVSMKNYLPIHSASIIYNDKAYLFAASSGVGKSTHTNLWHDIYGVDILDGDVCLCKVLEENGKNIAYAYGLPWCGTSDIYQNKKVEFAGIIYLARGSKNEVLELEEKEVAYGLLQNNFAILLDEELADEVIKSINELSKHIKGYKLWCLPNKEAVDVIKDKIT